MIIKVTCWLLALWAGAASAYNSKGTIPVFTIPVPALSVKAALAATPVVTAPPSFHIDLGLLEDDINADYWFAKDKAYHWGVSAFLAVTSYGVYQYVVKTRDPETTALSCLFTFAVGLAKEDFDKYEKKSFMSPKDLGADAAGIATGLLMIAAGKKIF